MLGPHLKRAKIRNHGVGPDEIVRERGAEILRLLTSSVSYVEDVRVFDEMLDRVGEVLDDDPADPTYVQTVARRGYRFIAPVETLEARAPEVAGGAPGPIAGNGRSAGRRDSMRDIACARASRSFASCRPPGR